MGITFRNHENNLRSIVFLLCGLFLIVGQVTIAQPIQLDTSTTGAATGYPPNRHNVYDPVNKLFWTVYHTGSYLKLAYSSNGTAWTKLAPSPELVASNGGEVTPKWAMANKTINNVTYLFIAAEDGYDIALWGAELGNGKVTWAGINGFSPKLRLMGGTSFSDRYRRPAMAIDDNNHLWITGVYEGGGEERQRLFSVKSQKEISQVIPPSDVLCQMQPKGTGCNNPGIDCNPWNPDSECTLWNSWWNRPVQFGQREIYIGELFLMPQGGDHMYLLVNSEKPNIVGWLNENGTWTKEQAMTNAERGWFSFWAYGGIGYNNRSESVYSVAADSQGIYFGGSFTGVGPQAANYIVRWDGSAWDNMGSAFDKPVHALEFINGTLYAGGEFAKPSKGIARFDGNTWRSYTSGISSGLVRAIVEYKGKICVGGKFSIGSNTTSIKNIACWNESDNKWEALGAGIPDDAGLRYDGVYTLAAYNNKLYIGGEFTKVGGIDLNTRLVAWDGISSSYSSVFKSVVDAPVWRLRNLDNSLYIGGSFSYVDPTVGRIDRLVKYDGSNFYRLEGGLPYLSGTVYDFAMDAGKLYVVGGSTAIGGDSASNYIARLNGTTWERLGDGLTTASGNSAIRALAFFSWNDMPTGLAVGAGCEPSATNTCSLVVPLVTNQQGSLGLSATYWVASDWEPIGGPSGQLGNSITGGDVYALQLLGDTPTSRKFYVGGSFDSISRNSKMSNIAMWDEIEFRPLGSGVNGGASPSVRAIFKDGNDIYVGGKFTSAYDDSGNAIPGTTNIAMWDGSAWHAVGNGVIGIEVYAITRIDGDLYAAGATGVKRLDNDTWANVFTGEAAVPNKVVRSLSKVPGSNLIYICGDFSFGAGYSLKSPYNVPPYSSAQTIPEKYLTGCAAFAQNPDKSFYSWVPMQQGIYNHGTYTSSMGVYTMRAIGTDLWVGGNYTQASDNYDANYISQWQPYNWRAFGNGLSAPVYVIEEFNNKVYVGGDFQDAGGDDDPDSDGLAVWMGNSEMWTAVTPGIQKGYRAVKFVGDDVIAGGVPASGYFNKTIGGTPVISLGRYGNAVAADAGITTQVTTIVDSARNIYLAYTDTEQNLQFRKWNAQTKSWGVKTAITSDGGISYPSLTLSNDEKYIFLFYVEDDTIKSRAGILGTSDVIWSNSAVEYYHESGIRFVSFPPYASREAKSVLSFTSGDVRPFKVMVQVVGDIDNDGILDPADDDIDGDGLSNEQEDLYGSEPYVADTDKDGVLDGQEINDGTNLLDPGSFQPTLSSTVCSEWNGFLGINNIVENVNLSPGTLKFRSTLYNIKGVKQPNPMDASLKAGTQYDLLVNNMTGFVANSYGKVCAVITKGTPGTLDGRMVYYKQDNAGSYQFAFAMPFGNGLKGTQYVQFNTTQPSAAAANASNPVANWIQITNLEGSLKSGTLKYYDNAGKMLFKETIKVPSGGRMDRWPSTTIGAGKFGLVEWIPADTTSRFQVRNVRYYYDNALGNNSFDSAFQWEGVRGSGETLIVPLDTTTLTADSSGSTAKLEISNTYTDKTTVAVDIYSATGQKQGTTLTKTLAKRASLSIDINSILKKAKGVAVIKGTGISSVIATSLQVRKTKEGKIQNVYAIQATQATGTVMRGSYNTFLKQECRLLLANPTAKSAKVTISMKNSNGKQPITGQAITVSAHGLYDFDLCSVDVDNLYGVVTVQPTTPNSLQATVLRIGEDEAYRFPTPVRE